MHLFIVLCISLCRRLGQALEIQDYALTDHVPRFALNTSELEAERRHTIVEHEFEKVLAGLLYAANAGLVLNSRENARVRSTAVSMAKRLGYKEGAYKEKASVKRGPIRGISHQFTSTNLKQGKDKFVRNLQGIRITGGSKRNSKIETPAVYLRPLMARVREAFFSMIYQSNVLRDSASCIDFYSGAGTGGIEALSRGIGSATMVDFSSECAETISRNVAKLGLEDRAKILQARTEDVLRSPEAFGINKPFDLVMLTPPYEEVIYDDLMNAVAASPIVDENTIVMVEYPIELGSLPHVFADGKLVGYRNRKYGRTIVAIYVCRPTGSLDDFEMRPEEFVESNLK